MQSPHNKIRTAVGQRTLGEGEGFVLFEYQEPTTFMQIWHDPDAEKQTRRKRYFDICNNLQQSEELKRLIPSSLVPSDPEDMPLSKRNELDEALKSTRDANREVGKPGPASPNRSLTDELASLIVNGQVAADWESVARDVRTRISRHKMRTSIIDQKELDPRGYPGHLLDEMCTIPARFRHARMLVLERNSEDRYVGTVWSYGYRNDSQDWGIDEMDETWVYDPCQAFQFVGVTRLNNTDITDQALELANIENNLSDNNNEIFGLQLAKQICTENRFTGSPLGVWEEFYGEGLALAAPKSDAKGVEIFRLADIVAVLLLLPGASEGDIEAISQRFLGSEDLEDQIFSILASSKPKCCPIY